MHIPLFTFIDSRLRNRSHTPFLVLLLIGTFLSCPLHLGHGAYQSEIILNVQDFGATGNGTTDDATAIQQAISYAVANGKDLYFPSATYAVGTTLIIPRHMDYTMRSIKIDCGNSTFKLLGNITLFTSGYLSGSSLVTNYGTPDDAHYSTGIVLENFKVTGTGTITAPALKIQDWHQGCIIRNIATAVHQVVLQSHNNYYTLFDNIRSTFDGTTSGARFVFGGQHNLNKITGLLAVNSQIGYQFIGPITACHFTNNSVEGVGIGIQFDSTVYNISIENNYIENFSDTAIKFNDYVVSADLSNNYVNFIAHNTAHFVSYSPSPLNNITIDSDNVFVNMPSLANIIKNVENSYATGIVIRWPKESTGDIDDLHIPEGLLSQNIDWDQKMDMPGMRANVVNTYATGNYSGRFTSGHNSAHGFTWINTSSANLRLKTKIVPSSTQRIYVNLYVYGAGAGPIAGEFIGSTFYKYGPTGISASTDLSVSTVGGFIQINGTFSGTVTECFGEVRLM